MMENVVSEDVSKEVKKMILAGDIFLQTKASDVGRGCCGNNIVWQGKWCFSCKEWKESSVVANAMDESGRSEPIKAVQAYDKLQYKETHQPAT